MTTLISALFASLISLFTVASAQPYIDARLPVEYASVGVPVTPIVTMDRVYELSSDTAIVPTAVEQPPASGYGNMYTGDSLGFCVGPNGEWILAVRPINANGPGPWTSYYDLTSAFSSSWTLDQVYSVVNSLYYSGSYLGNNGSVVNTSGSSLPFSNILSLGFLGIGKDLMGTNGSITGVWNNFSTGMSFTATSIGELLRQSFRGVIGNLYYGDINTSAGFSDLLLSLDGSYSAMSQPTLAKILSNGLTGLSHNMEYSLTGGHRTSYSATFFSFGDDDSVLTKSEEEVTYSNLLEALVGIGQQLQQPLSQLQAVLANDDELELRQQTEPEVDAVIDGFTGEGQGAPSVSQIGDMANVSGDMSSLFDSGVEADDFFTAMTTGDAFEFFSQETANDLDTTNAPALYSVQPQDDFEGLVQDSDGFYSLADLSFFDLSLFLGKGG